MKNENFNAGLAYSDYKTRKLFYMLAAFVAFAMSSYFVVGYLAGHLRIMEWDGSQWMNGLVAVGITAVMTGYQFILYGAGNVAGGKKATIIAVIVAVSFSLLSEVGQGMERDHIRMETKSQESPTYQAIVGAIGSPTGANPYSTDLQAAEVKLAQCEARLAQGKEKHCEGSAARVEAVNKMIANHADASQQKALALAATAKTMEKDESNYHPLVNVIREFFSASGTIASFLLSLVLISFFEYAFHYLGGQFAAAREYLMQHGYDVTRQLRQPPRKFDGSISTYSDRGNESAPMAAFTNGANSAKQTVGEYAAKVEAGLKSSPEVIATEYARAQHGRNQQMEAMGNAAKAVGDKLESMSGKPDQAFMNEMLKSIKFQLLRSELEPTAESLYPAVYKTLYDAGYETPRKTVMKLAAHLLEHLATKDNVLVKHGNEYQLSPRWRSDAPVIQEVQGFKQSPEQAANVSKLYQAETAKHEAGKVFRESPTPEIKRQSVAETIRALVDAVKKSGAKTEADIQAEVFDAYAKLFNPCDLDDKDLLKVAGKIAKSEAPATPSPAMPFQQRTGATGLHNPALGTAEAVYPLPLTTSPELPKGSKGSTSPTTSPNFLKEAEGSATSPATSPTSSPELPKGSEFDQFYTLFKGHVQAGGKFSEPACFDLRKDSQFFSQLGKVKMNPIWNECLDRMAEEGILKPNSDYIEGSTYPRYKRAA